MRFKILSAMRLTAIIQGIADARFATPETRWLGRTRIITRDEQDIIAGFDGDVYVADIITDDARAVTYSEGRGQVKSHTIPNVKHGFKMDQRRVNELIELEASGAARGTRWASFNTYLQDRAEALMEGIRQRMDILSLEMRLDNCNYNRLGVILQNVTWGMPAALKANSAVFWTDATNSTPISDLENYLQNAQNTYGLSFNRITMSTEAMRLLIASDEFKARLALIMPQTLTLTLLPFGNLPYMRNLVESLVSGLTGTGPGQGRAITIELDDRRFKQQMGDGSDRYIRPFPADHILFDNSADDNNPAVMRYANAVVTESVIASVADTGIQGRFAGPTVGPVSYAIATHDLNPANLSVWGVQRGFPEKVRAGATGRLRVGYFQDGVVRQPDIF